MSDSYSLIILPAAQRQIKKLDATTRKRVARKIDALGKVPRPPGVKKLTDSPDRYRVRAGDHRIIYKIQDKMLLITVVEVGHRSDIY
jgi:mRNA interferase RelE/StbE